MAGRKDQPVAGASHRLSALHLCLGIAASVVGIYSGYVGIQAAKAALRAEASVEGRNPVPEDPEPSPPVPPPAGPIDVSPPAPPVEPIRNAPPGPGKGRTGGSQYINSGMLHALSGSRSAIIVMQGGPGVEQRFASALQASGIDARIGFFTTAAFRDGIVDRIVSGDAGVAAELGLSGAPAHLIWGRLDFNGLRDTGDLLTTDGSLSVTVVPLAGGGPVYREFTARGAGFDGDAAYRQAERRLIEKFVEDVRGLL